MNINLFIKEFNERTDKIQCIKEHIVEKYVPYEKKMAICKNIIESADYTPQIDVIDKKYYCPNTPMRFVLFCMSLIDIYTDIELEKYNDSRDVMGGFNQLDSNGVFEIFFKELDKEYNVMTTILQMMVDDCVNKENNLVSFFSSKIDSLKALYDISLPYISKQIGNKNS